MDRKMTKPFEDASVWTARDFPAQRSWVRRLEPRHLEEIDAALAAARRSGVPFWALRPADFPLHEAAELLSGAAHDLERGRGFAVIGGFPVERYGYDDNLLAYAGLSSYLGRVVDQSYAGAKIVDVRDTGATYSKDSRGYQSSAMLRFHSDGACLTGLMCLGAAAEGGLSVLTSAGTAHNAVLAERPDLYEVLAQGFRHHRRGEHAPGEPPVSEPIPVFSFHDGLMHCVYDRNQSLWAADAGVDISPRQIEAMDCLDAVLARPELQLHMEMQVGDIQYVNNFTILHARTAFRDGPGRQRHLLRLWLDAPESRWRGPTMRDLYVQSEAA
jgi:hypothetical protein